jgi:hypothetical protein
MLYAGYEPTHFEHLAENHRLLGIPSDAVVEDPAVLHYEAKLEMGVCLMLAETATAA